MCLSIYLLGSVILFANTGQCELSVDKAFSLLSSRLDEILVNIKLEQNAMKKDIHDLMATLTATNQQVISLEKRLSEVATFNQQMVGVQERLDNMDSHVKDVASAEVGRRTHMLRRGLEQEKAATQSRFENTRVQIFKLGQDFEGSMKNTSDLSARVDIFYNKHDMLKSEMKQTFEKTGAQIATLQQEVVTTQRNTQTLQSRVDTFESAESDLQSKTMAIESQVISTRGQIATVQQEVVTTQSRVDTMEKTQSDLQSKTSSIATQVDTTRGQMATVQQEVVTTQRNTQTLQSRVDTMERTQLDLQSKTSRIATQVDTTRGQISRLQNVTGTFVGFSVQLLTTQPYYNKNTVIKFNAVNYNDGSHYSTSTGIFTVPVSGVYVFMFNVEVYYDSSDKERRAFVDLNVNGKYKASAFAGGDVSHFTGGNAAVLKVLAGDRVCVSTASHHERNYIGPYETTFSGALLHVI